jgi:general secretion pathway protein D
VSRALAVAAALVLLVAGRATAQEGGAPGACPPDEISLNYPNADITDVIAAIAAATKKNFLYDDRVRGTVTVLSTECIGADEAYRVFESILQVKGFTTVEGPGGILKIIPVRDAKESPIDTVPGEERVPNRDLYITRLIPLRFIKADAIANALRPLVSKDANMVEYLPTNTIILTDSAANVRRLLTIIEQIDVETYQEQIKVIPIQYADAGTLAEQLSEIFGGQVTSAGGAPRPVQRARRAQPTAQVPAAADSAALGEQGQPRFITDDRTNSLIVIAPGAVIERVERTIALLDYKRRGSGRIHVYRLQNADAEEMAATLASLAGSGGGGAIQRTSATGALGGATPAVGGAGVAGAVASFEDGAKITADAPTNSLIIQASAEGYSTIREVIEALDTRRPQVMVEALILEVDVTDSKDLGSAWLYAAVSGGRGRNRTTDQIDSITGIGSAQSAAIPDLTDPNGLTSVATDFTAAILGKTISIIDPATGAVLREVPVIQGVITAAQSNTDLNIISAPTVLTADNEEAQIVIGQEIPIPTSRLQTPTTGGVTDPNTSQFTTSSNIERQNVGVTLRVTPQISEGDSVRLEIFQELSDVVEGSASDLGPTTTKRTVENTVYVSDGEAVMVGGIVSEAQNKSEGKVPWLGDIPILGWAFKSTGDSSRKVNLVVILTPRIVRNPGDLQRLTVENREEFRSAAGERIEYSGKEQEAREKALRAGLDLPIDTNPVRRELSKHEKRYPTEQLPSLREEQARLESERQQEIKQAEAAEAAGEWVVQVSFFRDPDDAATLLNRLVEKGYDGSVFSRVEQKESVHYVQLGPYPSLDKAQQVAREVGADTGLPTTVLVGP